MSYYVSVDDFDKVYNEFFSLALIGGFRNEFLIKKIKNWIIPYKFLFQNVLKLYDFPNL